MLAAAGLAASDLDAIFAPLAGARDPGLAVLVRQDGRTLFERGYGVRDLRGYAKIEAATNFRLASFTKQFTAMAVMLLVHDGKLRYDTSLTEVFPGFPAYGRAITIRDLLHHMSGLADYEELMDSRWTAEHQIQDAEVLDLLQRESHGKFAPGTSWAYSNSGYVVLGLVVAKVSGQPFDEFLLRRIFAPLHMDRTIVYLKGRNTVADRAYGHSKQDNKLLETDQSSTSATLGDGGIYSNLPDLAKWDDALRNHTLLSEAEMRPALVPATLRDGGMPQTQGPGAPSRPMQYGFGWFLDPYQGRSRMWHTGGTMGFRTVIERFTGNGLTIVILCNRTDLDPEKLALQVAAALPQPTGAN
jgi:CubicO group peptidase (beta-lactamase class C family)